MKSLNIKIPLSIAQRMDDSGHLNPQFVNNFVHKHLMDKLPLEQIEGTTFTYTLKVAPDLHRAVKIKAIENNVTMNEFVGRLLVDYYNRRA